MENTSSFARDLSDRLVAARRAQRAAAHVLAALLVELCAGEHYRPLGYASMEEYASIVLDLTAREARDLVRIGRALPKLPLLAETLRRGDLEWTKARELLRVVTPENEARWLAETKGLTSRAIEDMVAHRKVGDPPPAPGDPGTRAPEVRRFSVRLESADYDTLRSALAQVRAELAEATPEELDDGDLLAVIVQEWIALREQATEPVSAERYRVVVDHCPTCATTHVGHSEVSDTVVGEAACDAEVIDIRPGPKQGHVTRTIPPAIRRLVLARARWRCEVPGCRNRLWLDIHHIRARADGGTHDPRGLVCLCGGHHRAVHRGYMGVERDEQGRVVVWRAGGAVVGLRPGAPPPDTDDREHATDPPDPHVGERGALLTGSAGAKQNGAAAG